MFVVFSIIGRISKTAKKQQQQQQQYQQQRNSNTNASQKTTLQSQLNNALRQINDIKNYVSDEVNNANQSSSRSVPPARNGRQPYSSSLEGYQMEGHQVEGYQMEGAKVEGYRVEGQKVEGIEQKHDTNKFSSKKLAVTESSMQRGYAGEGCDEHYDMEIAYSSNKNGMKAKRKPLYFSDNPIIQGVVMSQVLERGKRR